MFLKLNSLQKLLFEKRFKYLISNLSVRAAKRINKIFYHVTTKNIIEKLRDPDFEFKKVRLIGLRTLKELDGFRKEIYPIIDNLKILKNRNLLHEYAVWVIKTYFRNIPDKFYKQFSTIIDANGKIRLFKLIHLLIKSGYFFKKITNAIFEFNFMDDPGKKTSLKIIGKKFGRHWERTRQIKIELEKNFSSIFQFSLNFSKNDLIFYKINSADSLLIIDQTLTDKINKNERVNFNRLFYGFIFKLLLKEKHFVFGASKVGTLRGTKLKTFNCLYLIPNKFSQSMNFEGFMDDVRDRLCIRIPQDYLLDFDDYLSGYLLPKGKSHRNELKLICKVIILHEFTLEVNSEGFLVFKRNTSKLYHEYIVEILAQKNRIMNANEIAHYLNLKYPFLEATKESVSSTISRFKNIFIYFGISHYGLKKWETEKENIKGGTIRDLVKEYLTLEKRPKHILNIFEYVLKYRRTNLDSVFKNILIDNRFKKYSGSYIGLRNVEYELKFTKFKNLTALKVRTNLQKMNGWKVEKVINYFVKNYQCEPVQIRYLIQRKIMERVLTLTSGNRISLLHQPNKDTLKAKENAKKAELKNFKVVMNLLGT